ncbi:MacS family sensor histidine kinase [Dermacoccaceae bacterium W4C1]
MSSVERSVGTEPLWRAAQAFRGISLCYAIGMQVSSDHLYERPVLSWVLIALQVLWSGIAVIGYVLARRRTALVIADVVIATALMLASLMVAERQVWSWHESLPTTLWVANAVVSVALLRGPWWGMLAGLWLGLVSTAVAGSVANLWRDATLVILVAVGLAIGVAASSVRRAHAQLEAATRMRAATAERERLAADVHDGALQVLAMMRRRGQEHPHQLGELGRLAGEQERALRLLLTRVAPAAADGEREQHLQDVLALVQQTLPASVTVSGPPEPVWLPGVEADQVVAAAQAAVTNAAQHAGEEASVFVLVEELPDVVCVTVRDDGVGMDEQRESEALAEGRMGVARSIRGRLRELGGEAVLVTAPGDGVEWELRVPRDQEVG